MQLKQKKKLFKWLQVIIVIYCLLGIAAYYLQDRLIFHPKKIDVAEKFAFSQPFNEINIRVDQNTSYNVIQFTTPVKCKGVVLYYHGNRNNITYYSSISNIITKNGYEVWMMDYPGFGKSTGKLSEQILYEQALQLYKMARARFSPDSIIIYGRSLGTGIAAELASVRDCKRLILETPYYSMTSLANRYLWMYPIDRMLKYKFPTNEYLINVTAAVTIFHGTKDALVPYSNAEKLKGILKKGDEFITIEGGSHNNLISHLEMTSKLSNIFSQ